jgi:hypothetical protein
MSKNSRKRNDFDDIPMGPRLERWRVEQFLATHGCTLQAWYGHGPVKIIIASYREEIGGPEIFYGPDAWNSLQWIEAMKRVVKNARAQEKGGVA